MSPLERRYRRLLALLPASYRARWEEEMLATFLASMHSDDPEQAEYLADYGRPSWSETASVVALAIRLRLGGTASPRDVVRSDAVRLVALIGLLVHACTAPDTVLIGLWLSGRTPWPPAPESDFILHGPWLRIGVVVGGIWLAAYLALLFGGRRAALLLASAAVLVTYAEHAFNPIQPFTVSTAAFAAFDLLTVACLAGFHRDVPPIRYRPWLVALAVGLAVDVTFAMITISRGMYALPVLDWPASACIAVAIAVAAHLARRRYADPSWTLALAMLAAVALGLRLLTLPDYVAAAPQAAQRPILVILGLAEVLMTLLAAVPITILAVRALRRLPKATRGMSL